MRNEIFKRIKETYAYFHQIVKLPFKKVSKNSTAPLREKPIAVPEEIYSFTYRIIGEKIEKILPLFRDLDLNLQKAGLKVNFKAYVSLTFFTTFLTALTVLIFTPFVLVFAFNVSVWPAILFGVGGSLFACAFSIIGFYAYPIYRADKLKRELEDELPFTTGYMAILASAGVPPEKIFYSLSNLNVPLAASTEAKNIVTDINLFGLDVISALEKASKRTPSEKFQEMLEGFIATIHSGSNLAAYLREKSRQYMRLKRINLKKFSDTLSILAEFYVALLITGPLLLIIMLAVMEMMGGGALWGTLEPNLMLNILTYMGIPLGSIMFLIILDAITPKW